MHALKPLLVLAALALALALLLSQHSTSATLTDASASTANAFATRSLQAPALIATASGASANLSWTNPDALSGPDASFIVQRASGDCTAPAVFTPLTGSPFATAVLATTDTPGASGTYCYQLQSALHSWRSPAATAAVTLRVVTVPKLRLLAADPGVCGAGRSLSAAIGAANVVVPGRSSVTFAAAPAEALTSVPAGTHVATLVFPGVPGAARSVSYTVELGTCAGTAFTPLAAVSDAFVLGRDSATRVLNLAIPAPTTLNDGTYLAVRITNHAGQNLRLNGPTGESTLDAPAGGGY